MMPAGQDLTCARDPSIPDPTSLDGTREHYRTVPRPKRGKARTSTVLPEGDGTTRNVFQAR